jgi:hypothetical protein
MAAPLVLTARDFAAETKDAAPALTLSPDAALVAMADGNTFVVDMAGDFLGLPTAAAEMLRRALVVGEARAAAETAARHGVAPETVAADLRKFLADLERRGVLVRGRRRRANFAAAFAAAVFARAIRGLLAFRRSLAGRAQTALTGARLSFALFGWTATIAAWRRVHPKAEQVAADPAEIRAAVDAAVRGRATKHWIGVDCKERGLAAWALLRAAGLAPQLNIGVVPYPLAGHCWCTADGAVVADDPTYAQRFTPVLAYA